MIDPELTIGTLREAAQCLRSPASSLTDELRAIQTAQDALEAVKVERMALLAQSKEHEIEGASTLATWAKVALRQDGKQTRTQLKAARTVRVLPDVGEAAAAGSISLEHVRIFTYGLAHIGEEVMVAAQDWLLDLARTCEPAVLFAKVKDLRAAVHPDELDEQWAKGMAKEDIMLSQTIDGWFLTGFLGIEAGTKLHTVLQSLSVPRAADDDRDAATRRVDAMEEMLDSVLESGLPADNGVRPHLSVIVDSEKLREALTPDRHDTIPGLPSLSEMARRPAHLVGFGPIGSQMLGYLTCQSDLTPILVDSIGPNAEVLDVGRSSRYATLKQRRAIHVRQVGQCATPGCSHPIRHLHHVLWWAEHGGRTDLDNLVGLCGSCHRLVHAEKLVISTTDGAGHAFANARGRPLRDRQDLQVVRTLDRAGPSRPRRRRAA